MSDFSDRSFVAGSLVGLRAFDVDTLGRLRAPSFDHVFTPGENVAACKKGQGGLASLLAGASMSFSYDPVFYSPPGRITIDNPAPPAPPASKSRWWRRSAEPTPAPAPKPAAEIWPERWEIWPERWEIKAIEAPKPPEPAPHAVGQLDCQCGFYAYTDGRNDYKKGERGRIAGVVEGYGTCTLGTRGFRAEKLRLVALIRKPGAWAHPDGRMDRVLRNYPDVPVFESKAEALAAHPLTLPTWPTPESAEDFWTREAAR